MSTKIKLECRIRWLHPRRKLLEVTASGLNGRPSPPAASSNFLPPLLKPPHTKDTNAKRRMQKNSSHKTTKQHKYENGVAGRKCELAGKETGSSVINYGRRLIWPRQATLLIMRQHAALAATPINTQWAKKMYQNVPNIWHTHKKAGIL